MLRTLKFVLLVVLGLCLLTIAFANRAPVQVQFLPDAIGAFLGVNARLDLPLFLVIFAGIVAGLLIGFVWEWMREMKHRSAASRGRKQVAKLEREVSRLRDEKAEPEDEVIALLEGRGGTR